MEIRAARSARVGAVRETAEHPEADAPQVVLVAVLVVALRVAVAKAAGAMIAAMIAAVAVLNANSMSPP